jgi:hypothetical protein
MPNEFLIPNADDGHAEGDPPTLAEIAFDDEIDRFSFQFQKVMLPHINVAFELGWTLGMLRRFRPAFELDGDRRDKLVKAIRDTVPVVARRLRPYPSGNVRGCLDAAATIVRSWADDERYRTARDRQRLADARTFVKMLERDLQNISDFEWLRQRKAKRRHDLFRSLLTSAANLAEPEKAVA